MNTINNALKNIPMTVEHVENQIIAGLKVPQDFPAFEGHFPGNKILPAVSSLQLVMHIIERTLNQSLCVEQISKSHFKKPIFPDEPIIIQMDYEMEKEAIKIKANIKTNDSVKSSCNLILKKKGMFSPDEAKSSV